MNRNLSMLSDIAAQPVRRVLGLMSGTSLDGLDVALCRISGSGLNAKVEIEHFKSVSYSIETKERLQLVLQKDSVKLEDLTLLNAWLGDLMGSIVLHCLTEWNVSPSEVDLIASHGQTVYHAPKSFHGRKSWPNATLQIGDGDHIAMRTGIITLSDFRQKHVAADGEGAPLAVYGDYALYSSKKENRLLLNIGGIANFTFLPMRNGSGEVFVTDTGPGNALMDAVMQKYHSMPFDKDGIIAKSGDIDFNFLAVLHSNDFFKLPFPKTTGTELFNWNYIQDCLNKFKKDIDSKNLLATLNFFTAKCIKEAAESLINKNETTSIYISGGGALNSTLLGHLKQLFHPIPVLSTTQLGMNPEAKEAVLFAVLANETLMGNPLKFTNLPSVSMGKISLPD